jgi:hypothetical protein
MPRAVVSYNLAKERQVVLPRAIDTRGHKAARRQGVHFGKIEEVTKTDE